MSSLSKKELVSKLEVLSEFIKSDTEKIYLIIGPEEASRYRFLDSSLSHATQNKDNLVFRYEIWEGEHSRHFLYRWLRETVFGQAFVGFGQWSDIVNNEPQLMNQLQLLLEQDIRPLEIRFMEAIRFFSGRLKAEERMVLSIVPRSAMQDRVLVDFFRALLRFMPVRVKMLIFQDPEDILAKQSDFSPSNRILLDGVSNKEAAQIKEQYTICCQTDDLKGRLMQILAHLVHPVDLELLSQITGEATDGLIKVLESSELEGLLEQDSESRFRLAYPRTFYSAGIGSQGFGATDKQAVEYLAKRLLDESDHYPDALYHSLGLFRIEDPEFNASHVLAAYQTKLSLGGGDICEQELDHALYLIGDKQDQLRTRLLLTLGEVRESRNRHREALEALNPAIELLEKSEELSDHQHALELKGQAAFSMREMDIAKSAMEESLSLTRKMDKPDLTAGILSQLAYIYFSSKQLQKAEKLYRESLDLYQNLTKENEEVGRRGQASQWANLGHTAYANGDFKKAEEYHRKALEIFVSLADRKSGANQWGYLGHTYFAAQNFEQAIEAYEKAGELEEEMGETQKAAQRYANVGHTLYAQRKVDLANRSFQKALDKYRELGNPVGEAAQLSNLGLVKGDQGESEQAIELFEQAAQIYREMGDEISEAMQVIKMGHVRRAQKQYNEAVENYKDGINRFQKLKYLMGAGDTELDLGQLYSEKEEWDDALGCFNRAKKIFEQMGHQEKESLCLVHIGHTEGGRGQVDAAMDSYQKAMELYKKADNLTGVANVASQMALLQYEQKNYGKAERLYQEALEVFRKKEDAEGEANMLSNLGTLHFQIQQMDKAQEEFEQALTLLRNMNHPLGISGVLTNLSYIYEGKGQYGDAYAQLSEAREIYEQLQMTQEMEAIDQRIKTMDQKAGKSLEKMRSDLFPGLSGSSLKTKKSDTKIGRNEPCPCGSGKKYKKCCGA
jgi:tetratricopeptide (TPR) repeat protein